MKKISIDGIHFLTAEEAAPELTQKTLWVTAIMEMDYDIKGVVHRAYSPCPERIFLRHYLELAEENLVLK